MVTKLKKFSLHNYEKKFTKSFKILEKIHFNKKLQLW